MLGHIQAGCPDCFASLFRRYFHPVYALAYRVLRDRAEAEDLVQEVFLAIYVQQKRFDSARGSVRTWILQFAYFKALLRRRYLRIRKFYKQEELREAMESLVWSHPAADSWYRNRAGRVVTTSPWRLADYWKWTRAPNLEDYTLTR